MPAATANAIADVVFSVEVQAVHKHSATIAQRTSPVATAINQVLYSHTERTGCP